MRIDTAQSIAPASGKAEQDKKLKKSCQELEGVFMNYMLKAMRKTVTKGDLFGSAKSEEFFQDMMDSEICERAAGRQSMGLADLLYKQLSAQVTRQEQTATPKEQ